MIIRIQDEFRKNKLLTDDFLSQRLEIEKSALAKMLELLVKKGKIEKLDQCDACFKNCGKCPFSKDKTYYRWIE